MDTCEKVFDEYVKEDKHPNTNKAFRISNMIAELLNDDHLISVKESWIEDKWALKEENFISDKELEDAKNKFDLNKIIGFKVPLKNFTNRNKNERKIYQKLTLI